MITIPKLTKKYMTTERYGYYLAFCIGLMFGGMTMSTVLAQGRMIGLGIIFSCQGAVVLMLLGRCAWKWNKL